MTFPDKVRVLIFADQNRVRSVFGVFVDSRGRASIYFFGVLVDNKRRRTPDKRIPKGLILTYFDKVCVGLFAWACDTLLTIRRNSPISLTSGGWEVRYCYTSNNSAKFPDFKRFEGWGWTSDTLLTIRRNSPKFARFGGWGWASDTLLTIRRNSPNFADLGEARGRKLIHV